MGIWRKSMKNTITYAVVALFMVMPAPGHATDYMWISFGPMLHWNIGGKEEGSTKMSISLEAALWYESGHDNGYSIDVGAEYEFTVPGQRREGTKPNKWLWYSEFQLGRPPGIPMGGFSAGPVFDASNRQMGFQSSVWGCYLLGFDIRYRRLGGANFLCPGIFAKVPVLWWGGGKLYQME
jgi:hypothetical protein